MVRDDVPLPGVPLNDPLLAVDAELLSRLRDGDVEAGHCFVREHYPVVSRYLLYLTGHRETAEDLTQETFLQAWRHLDQFQGRAPLRLWLHAIARREFLRARRRPRAMISLEDAADIPERQAGLWIEDADLRVLFGKLPEEQREVMALQYLAGYSSSEIAQIIQAPARTVRYRLAAARARLAQALEPGDLVYLNEPAVPMRQWGWLPLGQMDALGTRLRENDAMERREFLRQAAVGATGLVLPEGEREVVDSGLTQKVSLAMKGTALSDLCRHLQAEGRVHVAAGPSVADEKVTIFCERMPLREVMRQLSRPFGYVWLRSGKPGEYRYELAQDLRSQLLEEELRNRDRNAALVAFEREMNRFRPYLDLSPDEVLAKAKTAPPEERKLLQTLAGLGWGPIQIYFRLSPQQMAALRSGQRMCFSQEPRPDQETLPPELVRGVLQCNRVWRVCRREDGGIHGVCLDERDTPDPKFVPLTALPEIRAKMEITLAQSELGQYSLGGGSGFFAPPGKAGPSNDAVEGAPPYVVGATPSADPSATALGAADARLARDPVLRARVSVAPVFSRPPTVVGGKDGGEAADAPPTAQKMTTADVLEAIHKATRMPIVADHYTRLFKPEVVSVSDQPLFEALNRVSEPMRLRWNKEGDWLQFRSASYYNDRLKEVANRLLTQWAEARRQHGKLDLDQIVEIAQLTDDQLDGADMAEGAEEWWGLKEWRFLRNRTLRPHVRFLAEFSPAQRQEMLSASGLPFTKMSLAQQQGFMLRAFQYSERPLQSLEELAGATLRVDCTQSGWYQWLRVGDFRSDRWAVTLAAGPQGKRLLMPPVRERTREAALQTARRLFPLVTEAMLQAYRPYWPEVTAEKLIPQLEQIAPTELDLVIVYIPGTSTAHNIRWARMRQNLGGLP